MANLFSRKKYYHSQNLLIGLLLYSYKSSKSLFGYAHRWMSVGFIFLSPKISFIPTPLSASLSAQGKSQGLTWALSCQLKIKQLLTGTSLPTPNHTNKTCVKMGASKGINIKNQHRVMVRNQHLRSTDDQLKD